MGIFLNLKKKKNYFIFNLILLIKFNSWKDMTDAAVITICKAILACP